MDLMTIAGLAIGLGAVYFVMAQGQIVNLLFNYTAAILVFGGTFGATLITYPWEIIKQVPKVLTMIVFPRKRTPEETLVKTMISLAERAKRDGIDSLREELDGLGDNFLTSGIQMLIDGLTPEIVRENLEKEIIFIRRRHQQISGIFRSMGTYAPIFGLLGTLIGVVQVLRDLSDPQSMGASMAIAITTTFYGIFGTNFIFLPIAGKLNAYSEAELLVKEIMIEGILSIQKGDIPIIVDKKLRAYLAAEVRAKKL